MKDIYDYQLPFRPNYEGMAAFGWMAGGLGVALVNRVAELPTSLSEAFGLYCGLMILRRSPAAFRIWRSQRRLRSLRLDFMDVRKLERIQNKHPELIWFGWGFEWGQRHAQLAYELLKRDISEIIGVDHSSMGSPWIHGIEPKERAVFQPIAHTQGHTLIVGTTGAGKSRSFDLLITQAVLRNEAVIIIDPKGDKDLHHCAERACRLAGKPERFVYFHPAFPKVSARLNPLMNYNRPSELASRIAQIMPSDSGNSPFKAFGQKSLDNIVQGLIATREAPNLINLRRYLEGGPTRLVLKALEGYFCQCYGEDWHQSLGSVHGRDAEAKALAMVRLYRDKVQPRHPNQDLEGLISMFEHDRTHFAKMVASLLPIMNMLTSGSLGPLLSPNPADDTDDRRITDSARIIDNAEVAYIGLDSLSDGMVGSAIGSILLADLASVAGDRYNYGVNNRPVNIFVDEAAEVINDPCIQLLNKGRGAKIRMTIATQTFSDFSARTGSDAKARQILGNVNNLIALRVMDAETQKYITDNLPLTRLRYVMRTQGVSTQTNNPALFSGNLGERLMEEQGELFPPQLLSQLPDLHYIAKLSGGRIVKGRIPLLVDPNEP